MGAICGRNERGTTVTVVQWSGNRWGIEQSREVTPMTERDVRDELILPETTNGNGRGKFATSRRGIMKAMALTTVGTAAAGLSIPSVLADSPSAEDTHPGGVKSAATFP